MSSKGYWVNNEHVIWKDIIKPCHFCGYCPYGQFVEEFPVPFISRADAIKHNNYIKDALAKGVFDHPEEKDAPLMTREMAEEEIANFDSGDYPEHPLPIDKMQCEVFGHHCPVYYHAELLAEDKDPTEEEMTAFENEINTVMEKFEKELKREN